MKLINYKRVALNCSWIFALSLLLYLFNLLYYSSTGGFSIYNIRSELPFDARWVTREMTEEEREVRDRVLSQKFTYLGKGCQSYVFAAEGGDYVIKFFKYQRMRTSRALDLLSGLPGLHGYSEKKKEKKRVKREGVFSSWKLAFDKLPKETGVAYVHLNKGEDLKRAVTIVDKAGAQHSLWIDDYEFMIQKKATMLCEEIDKLMGRSELAAAEELLSSLLETILAEYRRGLADNDHALMQNTGIYCGAPLHIDVGQFVEEELVKEPSFHMQELFTKTYKFRLWLREEHPTLSDSFDKMLESIIGEQFSTMEPLWRNRIEIFQ